VKSSNEKIGKRKEDSTDEKTQHLDPDSIHESKKHDAFPRESILPICGTCLPTYTDGVKDASKKSRKVWQNFSLPTIQTQTHLPYECVGIATFFSVATASSALQKLVTVFHCV